MEINFILAVNARMNAGYFLTTKAYRHKVVVPASPSLPSDLSDRINNLYLALA
nr:hypothetical protein [Bacteroidota bacterium]